MAKKTKKRTKKYTGADAAKPVSSQPVVHRYTAVPRGRFGQWWFEHKRGYKIGATVFAIIAFISWVLYEAVGLIN